MGRPESVTVVTALLWDPDLVGLSGFLPLDDWNSLLGLGTLDVEDQSVEQALDDDTLSLLDEAPSLVEPIILLPLDDVLSLLGGGSRNIHSLSRLLVDQQGSVGQLLIVEHVDRLESEHLAGFS